MYLAGSDIERAIKYEARMSWTLSGDLTRTSVSVTDLKWHALGRAWLGNGGQLTLDHSALVERLRADAIYLTLGLSRHYQGQYWPLVAIMLMPHASKRDG